jgi:hypothetical protein
MEPAVHSRNFNRTNPITRQPRITRRYGGPQLWSRDVTLDIADEVRRRYVEYGEVPDSILNFMEAHRR